MCYQRVSGAAFETHGPRHHHTASGDEASRDSISSAPLCPCQREEGVGGGGRYVRSRWRQQSKCSPFVTWSLMAATCTTLHSPSVLSFYFPPPPSLFFWVPSLLIRHVDRVAALSSVQAAPVILIECKECRQFSFPFGECVCVCVRCVHLIAFHFTALRDQSFFPRFLLLASPPPPPPSLFPSSSPRLVGTSGLLRYTNFYCRVWCMCGVLSKNVLSFCCFVSLAMCDAGVFFTVLFFIGVLWVPRSGSCPLPLLPRPHGPCPPLLAEVVAAINLAYSITSLEQRLFLPSPRPDVTLVDWALKTNFLLPPPPPPLLPPPAFSVCSIIRAF